MSNSTVKLLPKQTAEMEISIPWEEIKTTYQEIVDSVSKEMEISGFRKGKAPKEIVEKNLDKTKIYERVIQEIVPKVYSDSIKQHNLSPVTSPKIEILKASENQNWQIKATVALKPKVNLKNYAQKIKEMKKSKVKIWTPGKDAKENDKENQKPTLDEILDTILKEVEIELSDILISQETNRLLADLIDQTKKLGLSVEQYLLAKGKTTEGLKDEYARQATKNLSIEFALAAIADQEKITISKEELDEIIKKVEKPEERANLQKDMYYLAHLLRQQKTLDFLRDL